MLRRFKHVALQRIAETQLGLFTTRQAVAAGFRSHNHAHYVDGGHWIREHRGIYRLRNFPYDSPVEYTLWHLWSCNRVGEPQGVYSYETALTIYDLSDLNPAKLHMTVPPSFRRSAPTPSILVLHKAKLDSRDWNMIDAYRVTTPVRTLYDVVFSRHISEEFIYQTVQEGFARGMYPKRELKRYGILDLIEEYR